MARRVLLAALVVYGVWLVFFYEYHFLDGANLLFHEAGHVFFGLFGEVLGFLGGTLGQLVFPVACAVHFARLGRAFDSAVCVLWGGESLMYVAVYMGDANRLELPLVNDGLHDWRWLLGRFGLLEHAEGLAVATHLLASAVVIGALLLAARALAADGREEAGAPGASPKLPPPGPRERGGL